MNNNPLNSVINNAKRRRFIKRGLALLCALVLVFTMNTLKRDANTLERIPMCGYAEEHVHTPDCYDGDALVCGLAEHIHTDACYQEGPDSADDMNVQLADAPVVDPDMEDVDLSLSLSEDDFALVSDDVAPAQVASNDAGRQPKAFILGEGTMVSQIIDALGLGVGLDGIIEAAAVENDPAQVNVIGIEKIGSDYRIWALQDFARAQLALVVEGDILLVDLLDGVAVREEIEDDTAVETAPAREDIRPVVEDSPVDEVVEGQIEAVPAPEASAEVAGAQPDMDEQTEVGIQLEDEAPAEAEALIEDAGAPVGDDQGEEAPAPSGDEHPADVEAAEPAGGEEAGEEEAAPAEGEEAAEEEAAPAEGVDAVEEEAAPAEGEETTEEEAELVEGEETAEEEAEPVEGGEMAEEEAESAESEEMAEEEAEPAEDGETAEEEPTEVEEQPAEDEAEIDGDPVDMEEAVEAPDESGESGEAPAGEPADGGQAAWVATIDLAGVSDYPLSLNAMLSTATPAADGEAGAAPVANGDAEADPGEEDAGEADEEAPGEAPVIEYDRELLDIEASGDDHLITPVASFESTVITVDNGSCYALTLVNFALPEVADETEDEAGPEYPAQDFEGRTRYVEVAVSAPEGAFPAGTTMAVADVEDEKTLTDIEDTVSEAFVEVKRVHAVDITFTDAEGNEIEPLAPISVVMTVDEIEQQQEAVVVHVDDDGATEVVQSQSEAPEGETGVKVEMPAGEAPAGDESAVGFEADSFSVYAVVITETIDTKYIDAEGATWNISVGYGPEAGIPEGARLAVQEVEGDYLEQTAELLKGRETITLARFFDITILDAEGNEVQPAQPVEVKATLAEQSADAVKAVHFAEAGPEIIEASQADEAVSFDADSFSVYGIVYTVDFHYGVDGQTYTFTLPGGGAVGMRELAPALGLVADDEDTVDLFARSVENVTFSDESLVKAVPVEMNMTVGALKQKYELESEYSAELTEAQIAELNDKVLHAPDWALVSLKPFDTEETLTVSLATGETFTITVTDAQLTRTVIAASGEAYEITVTYGEDAAIPEGAELKVREILPEDEEYADYLKKAQRAASGEASADEAEEDADAGEEAAEANGEGEYARFFDIEIRANDQKVEPVAPVTVDIALADAPQTGEALKVVHFDEADGPVVMQTEAGEEGEDEAVAEAAKVRFETDGFSVYGVITDPTPDGTSGVGDLDGKMFTIYSPRSNTYAKSSTVDSNPSKLGKATDTYPWEIATWQFEAVPGHASDGYYYIYTWVTGQKTYLRLNPCSGRNDAADAQLLDHNSGQWLRVSKNDDGTYTISVKEGGTTYYLNEFGGAGGNGFAGYNAKDNTYKNDHFRLDLTKTSKQYIMIVNYGGKHYMVNNDATLTEVIDYDANAGTVHVEDPMLWTVDGNNPNRHIYFETEATGFTNQQLASDYYRRYLNPSENNALTEENSSTISLNPGYPWYDDKGVANYPSTVSDRSAVLGQTNLNYYNKRVYTEPWNANKFLGVQVDENGVPTRLIGNQPDSKAVEIEFALPDRVPHVGVASHTVNHIDISISGDSQVDVPLAYGTYYYKDDEGNWQEYHVLSDVTLTLKNDDVQITPEDMKHATIKAYDKNTGEELHDVFVVSGYSSNAHTEYSTVQVRIAGQFKVANIDPGPTWNEGETMKKRLANPILYVVSATKPLTFDMADLEHGQLYQKNADGTYEKLSVSLDIEMAASFDYFDERNECPVIQTGDAYTNWRNGAILNTDTSGMDFVLGGDAEKADSNIVAIEINKMIVDENGKLIKLSTSQKIVNRMEIWQNVGANTDSGKANSVKNLNVENYNGNTPDYSGYTKLREKDIAVSQDGMGQVYDYAVKPGMYFITEHNDEDSLPRTITDADGDAWQYKETYIKTEYVRRGYGGYDDKTAHPNPMHYSKTYTLSDATDGGKTYASAPEVLGWFTPVYGEAKKNGFLEFYVYNVYVNGTKLEVEKVWDTQNNLPAEGAEVTMELRYAKRPQGSGEAWPAYEEYLPVRGEDGAMAEGFASDLTTAISLTASSSDKTNWKGAFTGLPKTIQVGGQTCEVDYYAVETAVKVNGVDVTDQYKATIAKVDAAGDDFSDGKVTVTNALRPMKVTKKWYTQDGTEYTPVSAADKKVVVTAEVWQRGTTEAHKDSYKVTVNAKKQSDGSFTELWSGWVKQDSALVFSVGANKTSSLDGNCSVSTNAPMTRTGKQAITYAAGNTTTNKAFYKKDANVYRVRITDHTDISVTFPDEKVTDSGIGCSVLSMDAADQGGYTGVADDERLFEVVTLTSGNDWTRTWPASELDPRYSYYVKVDTIRESNTGDRFVLTGPIVTKAEDGTNVISLANTLYKEYVRLDVEKDWGAGNTAPENTEVTLDLYYYARRIRTSEAALPADQIAQWPVAITFGEEGYKPVAGDPLFADETLDATQLILKGDEAQAWKGAFEQLPKTVVDAEGNVYEVDYAVRETSVVELVEDATAPDGVRRVDVTGKFSKVHTKTRATEEEAAEGQNGTAKVTNTREKVQVTVKKQWQPLPTEPEASVTVELHRYAKKTRGSVVLTLTTPDDQPLEHVLIYLRKNGEPVTTGYTDANGRVSFTGLEPGEYTLYEFSVPDGYTADSQISESWTVTDSTDQQEKHIHMVNRATKPVGAFTLYLRDQVTGEPIQGATFDLYKDENVYKSNLVTDIEGRIFENDLDSGAYQFRQKNVASEAYMITTMANSETFTVGTESGKYTKTVEVTNRKHSRGSVTLTLTDPSGNPLSGGKFTLYKENIDINANGYITNSEGEIRIEGELPAGNYRFEQVSAPNGYDRTTDVFTFVMPDNGRTDNVFALTAVNKVHEETGNVSIKLWTKNGLTDGYSWKGLNETEGLFAGRTYTFSAEIKNGLYPNRLWLYVMEGDIDTNGTNLSGTGTAADQLPGHSWTPKATTEANSSGTLRFSFTPSHDGHYNLVLVTDSGNQFIESFVKVETVSNGTRLMAARPRMAANLTPATLAPQTVANGAGMTLATEGSASNVTTASPVSAPEGYMEDSTFAVKTYTLTSAANWQHTFDAEDKYDGQGNPYYYYVVETACSLDYYDLTSYSGDPVHEQDGVVTITNEAKRGSLTLTKTLAGTTPAGETDKPFTFTIAFSGDKAAGMAGKTYSATGAAGSVTVDGDRKATVTLKGGESVTLENLPYGVAYSVTEAEDPAYEQTGSTNTNGTVVKTTNASIENTRVVGQIDVTKTVELNGAVDSTASGKTFWVGIFSDAAGTTRVAGQDDRQIAIGTDGTGSTSFTNLPVGTYYVYELTAENGSAVTGSSATIGGVEYSVTTDNSGAVITKANRTGNTSITNNQTQNGSLIVNKVTLYNEQPDDQVEGKTIKIGLYRVDGQSETYIGTQEITLGANGTGETTFQELDYGTYKVYELNDDGQIVTGASATINDVVYTVSGSGTSKTIDSNAKNESVTITNKTEEKGSLAVTKEIRVDGVKANLSGSFKVALYQVTGTEPNETETQVGEPMNISVTNGESTTAKFENLEIGGTYRVYEVRENGAGVEKVGERFGQYAVSYVNQTVTIPRGVGKDVTGTKVANNIETKAVEVDKKWFRPDGTEIENIQNASIVVQLKKGNEVFAQDAEGHVFGTEGAVTLPIEGSWSYTWAKLPKYDENGNEIVYTVVETSAKLGESELLTGEVQATRDTDPNRANVFHLRNTLPTTDISVTKLWKQSTGSNEDRVFSQSKEINFTLYQKLGTANGEIYKENNAAIVGKVTYTPAANGNPASWSVWTRDKLPRFVYDETSQTWSAASYYVVEATLAGVQTTYLKGSGTAVNAAEGAIVADADTGNNRKITIINEDIPVDLNILKVDSNGMTKTLAGAGFELHRVNEADSMNAGDDVVVTAETDGENDLTSENGKAWFNNLTSGYYRVTETQVPAGYILTSSREFYIKVDIGAEHPISLVNWTGQGWTAKGYDAKLTFDTTTNTATVGNDAGSKLPDTGGRGTTPYYVFGSLLALVAVALLVARRRGRA